MNHRLLVVISILAVVGSGGLILWFGDSDAPQREEDDEPFQAFKAGDGEDAPESESRSEDAPPDAIGAGDHSEPAFADEDADGVGVGEAVGRNDESATDRSDDGSSRQPAEAVKERGLPGEMQADEAGSEREEALADLTREQVREGIEAFRPVVRKCYEETRETFPEAEGRVVLEFSIEASGDDGRVFMSQTGDDTTLFETDLHDCLLYNISEVEFDAPGGDGIVNVTYPIQFSAK